MKYTQSEIAKNILNHFRSKPDKPVPAIEIVRTTYHFAELTTSELKPYVSWLNEQVKKNNISLQPSSSGDPFDTKNYYLKPFQVDYWNKKNWTE
jgi:hypothetical protein